MPSFQSRIPNLSKTGPVIELHIIPPDFLAETLRERGEPIPEAVKVLAMIDTGSSVSVLKHELVALMGLQPTRSIRVNTPSHSGVRALIYSAGLSFPNGVIEEPVHFVALPLQAQAVQCLVGRDILRKGVFIYDGPQNTITLSF